MDDPAVNAPRECGDHFYPTGGQRALAGLQPILESRKRRRTDCKPQLVLVDETNCGLQSV